MNYKYKIGDQVVVTRIDDAFYFAQAKYQVGSKGTIEKRNTWENKPTYGIMFENGQCWSAKEEWLKPANQLIMCE